MANRFNSKVAVITGAGSGFGEAIAKKFAVEGSSVVVADIDFEKASLVATQIQESGLSATAIQVDVTQGMSMEELVRASISNYGKIDIFVNNAGVSQKYTPAYDLLEADFDRIFNVNMKSIYWSVVKAVPEMKRHGRGVLLNVTSVSALRPRSDTAWYCASKGAATTATKALALELAKDHIRVCALAPSAADTPLLAAALSSYGGPKEQAVVRQNFASGIPLGRLCTAADMANAALFLASDEADYITGVCLEVDGGRSI